MTEETFSHRRNLFPKTCICRNFYFYTVKLHKVSQNRFFAHSQSHLMKQQICNFSKHCCGDPFWRKEYVVTSKTNSVGKLFTRGTFCQDFWPISLFCGFERLSFILSTDPLFNTLADCNDTTTKRVVHSNFSITLDRSMTKEFSPKENRLFD